MGLGNEMEGHQPDDIVQRIDTFFKTEAELSEEDRLLAGFEWAIEHGFMTPEECDDCLRAFKEGYTATLGEEI